MLQRFLNGLVFGAGIGIALVIVGIIATYYVLPIVVNSRFGLGETSGFEKEVNTVPAVEEAKRFLGSPAIYSGGFPYQKSGVLTSGPGHIIGSALVNRAPLEGLKLRLALNGSVMSQWAITDSNGRYIISVPYGKYVIDGYDLDRNAADNVLPNKINHPRNAHSSSAFTVSEESVGHGLDISFVDPIKKKIKKNIYSVTEEVLLEWEPYPSATEYSIQVYEKSDPYSWSNNTLFEWSDRPRSSKAQINLKDYNVQLKPGHYYYFAVDAMDQKNTMLSETVRTHSGYDFRIVE